MSAGNVKNQPKPAAAAHRTRKIDVAGAAVCALLTVGVFWVGVEPMMSKYDRFLAQRKELEEKAREASRESSALKATEKALAETQAELERTPLRLQPASMINNRLAAITELAAKNGVKIEDIQPGKARPGRRYETVPILLAGVGDYRSCVLFLHRMREQMADVGAVKVKIVGEPGEKGTPAKFDFSLEWYAEPSGAAPAEGTQQQQVAGAH